MFITSQWRHISVKASQIIGNSDVCWKACSNLTTKSTHVHVIRPLCGGSTGNGWIPLTGGPQCGERFDVTTPSLYLSIIGKGRTKFDRYYFSKSHYSETETQFSLSTIKTILAPLSQQLTSFSMVNGEWTVQIKGICYVYCEMLKYVCYLLLFHVQNIDISAIYIQ